MKSDVASRVGRNVQHLQVQIQVGQSDLITFLAGLVPVPKALVMWAKHLSVILSQQIRNATRSNRG